MEQLTPLRDYLQGLYEAYDAFQTEYQRWHKRSKMHNKEPLTEYYLRWRDKLRAEIRRVEGLLMKLLPSPCLPCIGIETGMKMNEPFYVENYQLQNVVNSDVLVLDY